MKLAYWKTSFLLIPALLLCGHAFGGRLFKWADADGQVHYSNRLPPEAVKQERELINEQGRTLHVYKAPLTPEEKAEQQRLEQLEKKKTELARQRAIHDRSLLASYSSTDDMKTAMEGRISAVDSLVKLTSRRVKSMQDRLLELTDDAAGYERSGKQPPDRLQRQISTLRERIDHNKAFVQDKNLEIEDIRQQFEADIRRYIELTTAKPDTASSGQQLSVLEAAEANPDIQLTRHDRTLLATYASMEDLLFARDQKSISLNADITDTANHLETMQQHLTELSENFDEYQSHEKAPPDELIERMKELIREISETQTTLEQKRGQKKTQDDRFARDIARYSKLMASEQPE